MQHSISSYSVAFEPANCKNRTTVSWRNREKDFLCVTLEQKKKVSNLVEANLAKENLVESKKNSVEESKVHFSTKKFNAYREIHPENED